MYPFGFYQKGKTLYLSSLHFLEGNSKNKSKFINSLKKDPKISKLEVNNSFIFLESKEGFSLREYKLVYNPELFHPAPVINTPEGNEIWRVACWNRKPLEELITCLRTSKIVSGFEVLSFVKGDLSDVYLMQLIPRLSPKQAEAIKLAYSKGYYSFPRKIGLDKLARISGISKATFQEHLRRAEAKLVPQLLR